MANSPQARKRAKQNTVRRLKNHAQRASVRTAIKKFQAALNDGNKEIAQQEYQNSVSMIDSATIKGLHHKNRASRLKSHLNKHLKALNA